eukprot:2594769-Pleurochrysis_carterae.AAC.1
MDALMRKAQQEDRKLALAREEEQRKALAQRRADLLKARLDAQKKRLKKLAVMASHIDPILADWESPKQLEPVEQFVGNRVTVPYAAKVSHVVAPLAASPVLEHLKAWTPEQNRWTSPFSVMIPFEGTKTL